MLTTYHITVTLTTTTGTKDSTRPFAGYVKAIYVKYTSQATPSLTIKSKGSTGQPPSLNLLVLASAATDGWFFPQQPTAKAADGTALTGWYVDGVIDDYITCAVTAGGQAGSIDVWVVVDNAA